jgi:aminocarboxymuconate-semialdehyde decarboxylase
VKQTGVVDIHAHYYPESYTRLIRDAGLRHGARYADGAAGALIHVEGDIPSGPITPEFVDLPLRLAAMDLQGVQWQALSLTQPMVYFEDGDFSLALAQAYNDAVSAAHIAHPERLVGLATLPLTHPALALAELERAAGLPGVRGVYFGTNTGRQELSDRSLFPLYERIQELELPLFLHPVKQVGFDRLRPYFFRNLLGNPFETAVAAGHLIFGGVLDTFPRLEVCLPHAGGALPLIAPRMDRGHAYHPDCRHLPHPPSHYLRRFTYDTIGHADHVLRFLIDAVGCERIMLGSDYCFKMGCERPVEVITHLPGLDTGEQTKILRGTASRLLRLDE